MRIKEKIKAILPQSFNNLIMEKKSNYRFSKLKKHIKKTRTTQPIIFLLATPTHGNLGDQAIAIAERLFLSQELSEYEVVEITFNEYVLWQNYLPQIIEEKDIVCYHGGGNMGAQYMECENVFRDIIKRYPNNKIVTFPQTIFYDDSPESKLELDNSKKIYGENPNLILVAREIYSYEVMKENYGKTNDILLVPDIVLFMPKSNSQEKNGAMTCLRNDVEKKLTEKERNYIFEVLRDKFGNNITKSDTVIDCDYISTSKRNEVLNNKFLEFQKAKVVVTDRLHGMVFAFLTNTPCIVLNNYNYKVKGVYDWIKGEKNICFIDQLSELEHALVFVQNQTNCFEVDKKLYYPLKKAIIGE